MTKKEAYIYILSFVLIVFIHLLLIHFNVLKGELSTALTIDGILSILPLMSVIILYTRNKNKDTFAQRYLIVTTFQFIGFLSGILGMVYGRIPDVKYWSFSTLVIFLLVLIIQTVILLRSMISNTSEQSNKKSN